MFSVVLCNLRVFGSSGLGIKNNITHTMKEQTLLKHPPESFLLAHCYMTP